MRFIGGERAVIVGVHRTGGVRGLPVNAELDFDRDEQRDRPRADARSCPPGSSTTRAPRATCRR